MKTSENTVVIHVSKYIDHKDRLCEHNCLFCMERMEPGKSKKILPSLEEIRISLEEFEHQKGKIEKIYIAGGEPTLRPDFEDIVNAINKYCSNIILSSCCDYSDKLIFSKIKKLGIKKVATSIHGDNPSIHDNLTKKNGSFYRTIESIRTFTKLGIIVSVNSVICSFNILRIPKIVKLFQDMQLNIEKLTLTHYINHGNAFYHNELKFNIDDYKDAIKKAIDISQLCDYKVSFRDFPLCLDSRLESLKENIENINIIELGTNNFSCIEEQAPNYLKTKCTDCNLNKKCSHYLFSNYLEG